MRAVVRLIFIVVSGFGFAQCRKCYDEDINYYIPAYIPSGNRIVLKQETRASYAATSPYGPTPFFPGTFIYLDPNSKNEFFSIERSDPLSGGKVVIYWISDFFPFSPNSVNPLFRELRRGEKISVHNCVFVKSSKLLCFFASRPRSRTKFSVVVKVVGGKVVKEQTKSENENNSSFKTYGYYLSDFSAEVRENGEYSFEITANANSTVKEKDYGTTAMLRAGKNSEELLQKRLFVCKC